jgi:hypothetical protein
MADPFESSKRKIARANEHIADLEAKIDQFFKVNPYTRIVQADPERFGQSRPSLSRDGKDLVFIGPELDAVQRHEIELRNENAPAASRLTTTFS